MILEDHITQDARLSDGVQLAKQQQLYILYINLIYHLSLVYDILLLSPEAVSLFKVQ